MATPLNVTDGSAIRFLRDLADRLERGEVTAVRLCSQLVTPAPGRDPYDQVQAVAVLEVHTVCCPKTTPAH